MKTYKNITLSLVLVGAVVLGLVVLVRSGASGGTASLLKNLSSDDWVRGNPDAKVTLVEYSDFQCPACANYYTIVHRLTDEFGDRMKFVYRHFPLREIHAHAQIAAQAAGAAGKQGKFWEMHDQLFEHQKEWAEDRNIEERILGYAAAVSLDIDQFKTDLRSDAVEAKVNTDYSGGSLAGITGTPTFFLNGKRIQNPRNYDEFKTYILAEFGSTQ